MKKFCVIIAAIAAATIIAGCNSGQEIAWKAGITGQGKQVTGGSLGVQAVPPPVPTPAPTIEQLEKGNAAKVAAEVAAAKKITAQVTPICTGAECYVPYANATDVRSSPLPTPTPAPAWYNGFLP